MSKNWNLHVLLVGIGFFVTVITCGGSTPNQEDLRTLKQSFLENRSQAILNPKWRNYSDQELFFVACQQEHFDCASSIQLLQKHDPVFYNQLFPPKK